VAGGGAVHQHHAAAADAAHLRIYHALHESARDGGVDRVATAPQDLETYLGGLRLRTNDDRHERKLDQRVSCKTRPEVLPHELTTWVDSSFRNSYSRGRCAGGGGTGEG